MSNHSTDGSSSACSGCALQTLAIALQCAAYLSVAYNMTTPVLLLTDNALLRHQVAAGQYTGVVGPKVGPDLISKLLKGKRDGKRSKAKVRQNFLGQVFF